VDCSANYLCLFFSRSLSCSPSICIFKMFPDLFSFSLQKKLFINIKNKDSYFDSFLCFTSFCFVRCVSISELHQLCVFCFSVEQRIALNLFFLSMRQCLLEYMYLLIIIIIIVIIVIIIVLFTYIYIYIYIYIEYIKYEFYVLLIKMITPLYFHSPHCTL